MSSQTSSSNSAGAPLMASEMQRLGTRCWRLLITKGVPSQDARELAIAIIRFIYLNIAPSHHQKNLIERYYQYISGTELLSLQSL